MLVVLPLGTLVTAVVFDTLFLITGSANFAVAGAHAMAAGVVGGLLAALSGWVDWFAIPARTRAKRTGLVHGVGNVVVLALFVVAWLLRLDRGTWEPSTISLLIALAGPVLAGITAWPGGELVERLGVGVDDDAGLDASSSLERTVRTPRRGVSSAEHPDGR